MKFFMRWVMATYVRWIPSSMKFRLKVLQCRWRPRPMMSKPEISFISSLLSGGSIQRVVEFGAGGSTLYFPRFLPPSGVWSAVEFNPQWFQLIKKHVSPKVNLYLSEAVGSLDDAFMNDLAGADLVIVDGGADRSRTLDMVRSVNPEALVLLHDSWRASYRDATARYDRVIPISRPYGAGAEGPESAGGMTLVIQDSNQARDLREVQT